MNALRTDLDKLAAEIARKAAEKDTPLETATDALKALTGYFAAVQKGGKNAPDLPGSPGTFSFDEFNVANEEPNGRTSPVPDRPRRG